MTLKVRGSFSAIGCCLGGCAPRGSSGFLQEVANLGEQFDLRRRLARIGGLCGFLLLQGGKPLDGEEQHEGDDEEVDHDRDETSPNQYRALFFCLRKRV